jgi:hypothetical protein
MPPYFKNYLSKNFSSITLLDSKKREFKVEIEELENGIVKIYNSSWNDFVKLNLFGEQKTTNLCFNLVAKNSFEVVCFNECGFERCMNTKDQWYIKSCLLVATRSTVIQQVLLSFFYFIFLLKLNNYILINLYAVSNIKDCCFYMTIAVSTRWFSARSSLQFSH